MLTHNVTPSPTFVLVVDDDRDNLSLLSRVLGEHGCRVRLAPSGLFALESARTTPPDLILLDIGLPDIDGYTVCELLKDDERTARVPVIFLSARQATFDIVRAFAVGAVDYISKPFATEEMLARVQVHLSVQRMQRQLQHHVAQLEHEVRVRARAEAALREREAQIRSIGDNLPNGIIYQLMRHPDGTFSFPYLSGAIERITGYTPEQVRAQPRLVLDGIDEASRARYDAAVAASARDLTVFEFETQQQVADGSMRWRQFASTPRRLPDGSILWDGICIDVTERKELEAALREREALFRLTFEQNPLGAAMFTLDYRVIQVNDALCAITGYTRDELLARNFLAITHPDDRDGYAALAEEVAAGTREQYAIETRYIHKDGRPIWVYAHGRAMRDDRGQPLYCLALIEDIGPRKAAEAELERARLAAEQAARAKSEFVAQISHEIRTPMNAVIGLTTLLLTSPLNQPQRDDVEAIRRSGTALLALIDDILDFSKIEAGKLNLQRQPFALGACVEEALDLIAPLADARRLALRYLAAPALPHEVVGDAVRLRQILLNLLSNAVRFTEHGEIVVTLAGTRVPGAHDPPLWDISISVRDTGIGIEPAQLERIFQPFEQASDVIARQYGGSGLGLTISRRLAEMMGGQLRATSTPGVGSTFVLDLSATLTPVIPGPAPAHPALAGRRVLLLADRAETARMLAQQLAAWHMAPTIVAAAPDAHTYLCTGGAADVALLAHEDAADNVALAPILRAAWPGLPVVLWAGVSRRGQLLDQFDHSRTALLPLPIRPGMLHAALLRLLGAGGVQEDRHAYQVDEAMGARHPLRILLAEDNAINQQVARRLLARLGYQADVVANGLEVIEALKRDRYDLVLMDIKMPEMSGTEATTYIRTFWPPARQPRIAAMTAHASEEDRAHLLGIGIDDYIRKPVRLEELVRVLEATQPRQPDAGMQQQRTSGGAALDPGLFAAFMAGVGEGDPAADTAFIAMYVAGMGDELQQLRQALAAGDTARATRAAHTLKGLSLQLGAVDLAVLCGRIEDAGRAGDTTSGHALVGAADSAFTALQQTLADYTATASPGRSIAG